MTACARTINIESNSTVCGVLEIGVQDGTQAVAMATKSCRKYVPLNESVLTESNCWELWQSQEASMTAMFLLH